jgi:RimJ/RimL family protein N-acetyltransferase
MPDFPRSGAPRLLRSEHLDLYAATSELIERDMAGPAQLAAALGTAVPASWPPDLFGPGAMRAALAQLQRAPEQGWSIWYLAIRGEPDELVGVCNFKGRPDAAGSVEISYSILAGHRGRGFATEAVQRLVGWAFSHHNVNQVCAETMPHLVKSIRVLEKNGFRLEGKGSETGVVRYVVRRSWRN